MKKIINKVHLILGLTSGLVVFIVSLTGCLYVFEEEIRNLTQAKYLYVIPENKEKINVSQAISIVEKHFPKEKITQVRWKTAPESTIMVRTKSNKMISIHPYSGALIGVRDMETDFLNAVEHIHTSLLLGDIGSEIIKWNVLIFFILLITGLVLWFPKNVQVLKQALTVKWSAKWRKVNYDFHSIYGFYMSWILLPIALTGIWWTFDSVKDFVYWASNSKQIYKEKIVSEVPKSLQNIDIQKTNSNINQLHDFFDEKIMERKSLIQQCYLHAAKQGEGFNQVFINLPQDSLATIRVLFRYPYTSLVRNQSNFYYDQYSGKLLRVDLYQNYSTGDKIRSSNYDLHTGKMFGIVGKILAFLASLFATSLPITGFLIWYNKRNYKKKKELKIAAPKSEPYVLTLHNRK
ncbi:PepSY-associated TM helix domain-containing protein [Thermoflexibacter ruber]|uniref:Uncharacterized iron-regulated membrane protein n=1 Tax=Thermoflexibacter ruber TaxID=1003 RepID=A0A1I2FV35_9BACT|nr:PepSY-associated TM helix domain-containing protein [Thermoflexibacter ruber]SFF08823.1 Uncharacterized iron-regulated membrane protein [Thermoflexibacter ruber]